MRTVLVQLDTDRHPSVFDRVVAVDVGIDEVFSYGNVTAADVESLVHGAIFTRALDDLKQTAVFVGGRDVAESSRILEAIQKSFFGPFRVSVMVDPNGSNTTAAAAVLAASKHVTLDGAEALVLGGTGPVGFRVAQLLAKNGATVRVGSRSIDKAQAACERMKTASSGAHVVPTQVTTEQELASALEDVRLVIAAGAASTQFVGPESWSLLQSAKVAIDLNAVPPTGIHGIEPTDLATDRYGVICYGAIGVGGMKMKIHNASLRKLFTTNDCILDTDAIYAIGAGL